MKHSRFRWARCFAYIYVFILLPVVLPPIVVPLFALSARSFSQAANTTSHIKKPLIYQIGNIVHINADGERPLLRALDALQEKYGWIVNYEDPPYAADAAADAPSLPSRRNANARNSGGEGFTVVFTVGPTPESRPDENYVLMTVVNGYNESNAVAQFELRNENDNGNDNENDKRQERRFDVVGTDVRDHRDEPPGHQPILSLPITLTKEPRTAKQTIALICQQVREQSKIPVAAGAIDGEAGGRRKVDIGGVEVPARALLSGTVASMGDHLIWRLLYDSSSNSYELSVNGLQQ